MCTDLLGPVLGIGLMLHTHYDATHAVSRCSHAMSSGMVQFALKCNQAKNAACLHSKTCGVRGRVYARETRTPCIMCHLPRFISHL
jgi:hypothetical protein